MSFLNYDDVVAQLTSAGLVLESRDLEVDTHKPRRLRVHEDKRAGRAGWYRLYSLPIDGGELIVGSFGIWSGAEQNAQKIQLEKGTRKKLTADQLDALKARQVSDQKRAAAEREREFTAAATQASTWWRQCADAGTSAYLTKKGLPGRLYGSRISAQGNTVVPIQDADGRIYGLQVIYHDPKIKIKKGRDKDYAPPGLAKQGHFFLIGTPVAGGIVLMCEGFATGASLHEATGLPVIVAFDANNLMPVAQAARKRWRNVRILFCADDDWVQRCEACSTKEKPVYTRVVGEFETNCEHCGQPHKKLNAGVVNARNAALAVDGATVAPVFPVERPTHLKSISDFNDLHTLPEGGLRMVAAQINAALETTGWSIRQGGVTIQQGGGDVTDMVPRMSIEDAVSRYCGTYGFGGDVVFDCVEHRLVHKKDVVNLLPRHGWDALREHPHWRVVRDYEVGFDPTELDTGIKCNLFAGWPSVPVQGECARLLELLQYLCSNENNAAEIYHWILCWLAYPIQHRGAKMHSSILIHGPQGTGKSRFFEAVAKIYGPYGRVLGQEALEDKFNSDWAEKKLFIIGDEVLARQDMYHIKNRLKGFITGDTIRVNPKNLAAHNEKNQINIVFLSNERMPLVLENDDRRHLVIWVPPKLGEDFFAEVNAEINNGGVAALHHFLLHYDLGNFKPWTNPPSTGAKNELIEMGRSSEERFVREWMNLEIESTDGTLLPFCPCQGSHLFKAYTSWCERNGERRRGIKDLLSMVGKTPGWLAGKPLHTWLTLQDTRNKNRKMVVPASGAMSAALTLDKTGQQSDLLREKYASQAEWLTACFFAFAGAAGESC